MISIDLFGRGDVSFKTLKESGLSVSDTTVAVLLIIAQRGKNGAILSLNYHAIDYAENIHMWIKEAYENRPDMTHTDLLREIMGKIDNVLDEVESKSGFKYPQEV